MMFHSYLKVLHCFNISTLPNYHTFSIPEQRLPKLDKEVFFILHVKLDSLCLLKKCFNLKNNNPLSLKHDLSQIKLGHTFKSELTEGAKQFV